MDVDSKLAGVVVGVVGTGMMASAHAFRHSQLGLKTVIGSRVASRAQALAAKIPHGNVEGYSQEEMLEKANFIILAIPSTELRDFFDKHRPLIAGKNKMFVDLSVTFSRYGSPKVQPPTVSDGPNWNGPYFDMCNYLKDRLNDDSATFVKAWHNLYFKSIMNDKVQPVECARSEG